MVLGCEVSIHLDRNLAGVGGWNGGRAVAISVRRFEHVVDSVESIRQFEPNSLELLLLFMVRDAMENDSCGKSESRA